MSAPTITVLDPLTVTLDGQPSGRVVEVVANHFGCPVDDFLEALHEALLAHEQRLRVQHEADLVKLRTEVTAAHAQAQALLHEPDNPVT